MKKIFSQIMLAVALASPALADSFNLFEAPRVIVLTAPTLITAATTVTLFSLTNTGVDIHGAAGQGFVLINSFTNAGGALTATIETADDNTNWVSMPNYALATSTTINITNTTYGNPTNLYANQTQLMPGTMTTPAVYSTGFAAPGGQYLLPAQFTNTGAITITGKGQYLIGFQAEDVKRYMHIYYTPTGASTNDTVSATVHIYRGNGPR